MDELKEVIQTMKTDTALVQDVFPVEFCRGFTDLFEEDLLAMVEESIINRRILVVQWYFHCAHSYGGTCHYMGGFKLISLCKCIYKLIAKITAKKLKRILDEGVFEEQFAFLKGI